MVLHEVTPANPVGALEILCLLRKFSRVVLIVATRCIYIPSDENVDDVDDLAVRVGTDDVGHVALALLHVGTSGVVPVLHLPTDVLEVAVSKELDKEVANHVVGRGTVPNILCACALFYI